MFFYLKQDSLLVLLVTIHMDDCTVYGNPEDVSWFKSKLEKIFYD